MGDRKIIKGYKGVMDLDLTNVDPKFHKVLINQHYTDIDEYKKYQSSIKNEQRYDNTVGLALSKLNYENMVRAERYRILFKK